MIKEIEKAINKQVMEEEHSSRIYLAMASWCHSNGYAGAAAFLYKQSEEERMHQLKFMNYVNDMGGLSVLEALEKPAPKYESLKQVFEEVLKHEQHITSCIHKLYDLATSKKDFATANFLQWYVTEQIEEETTANGILDMMKLAGDQKAALFIIDKELSTMAAAKVIDPLV